MFSNETDLPVSRHISSPIGIDYAIVLPFTSHCKCTLIFCTCFHVMYECSKIRVGGEGLESGIKLRGGGCFTHPVAITASLVYDV